MFQSTPGFWAGRYGICRKPMISEKFFKGKREPCAEVAAGGGEGVVGAIILWFFMAIGSARTLLEIYTALGSRMSYDQRRPEIHRLELAEFHEVLRQRFDDAVNPQVVLVHVDDAEQFIF